MFIQIIIINFAIFNSHCSRTLPEEAAVLVDDFHVEDGLHVPASEDRIARLHLRKACVASHLQEPPDGLKARILK